MNLKPDQVDQPAEQDQVRWTLFDTNRQNWQAVAALFESARDSIDIEQFIFSGDGIGAKLVDLLCAQARRGVQVRILADWYGSRSLLHGQKARELVRLGGEVRPFHGVRQMLADPRRIVHRIHRKTVISDENVLLTGGSCFDPRMEDWRDTMVRINGAAVGAALSEFTAAWNYAGGEAVTPCAERPPPADGSSEWEYVVSSPYGPSGRRYLDKFLARIADAQSEILLASPYVTPAGRLWGALAEAAQRGVAVRVLIPGSSDHPGLDTLTRPYVKWLTHRGIMFGGYPRGMLHAKLAAIDDSWAAVGSFNLSIDSTVMNLECMLVSERPDYVGRVAEQLRSDLATAERL